ncbi:MAG: YhcH/YjgK/YiaL family protein [Paludibacteraceae bacterium]
MIYSTIAESERIEDLHPQFKRVFEYLKKNNLLNIELGRIELDGNRSFINNVESQLFPAEERSLEAHKDYLDIQIPLDVPETIGVKPTADCKTVKSAYNEEKDILFFEDKPTNFVTVYPGEFIILYPEDAHAPLIGEGNVRKLVVKIQI